MDDMDRRVSITTAGGTWHVTIDGLVVGPAMTGGGSEIVRDWLCSALPAIAGDNRRLRAACEAVHTRLETMDYDIADMTWCYMTLGAALAPAAAGGEGGPANGK